MTTETMSVEGRVTVRIRGYLADFDHDKIVVIYRAVLGRYRIVAAGPINADRTGFRNAKDGIKVPRTSLVELFAGYRGERPHTVLPSEGEAKLKPVLPLWRGTPPAVD